MTDKPGKDEVQIALEAHEYAFRRYKNDKAHESNRHPFGSPSRVEADLSEIEKAHLGLLQSTLQAAIAQQHINALAESAKSSDRLGRKVFWLNVVVTVLSAVVAASAVLELSQ
ncbi:hypothetical protein [Lysobacter sp. D1-1-M9]|uniref:hypothetical protein n=1 Tax=Novilysobacter longmucuonensis TaxID=3098603 RepID=UPI002FC67C9B